MDRANGERAWETFPIPGDQLFGERVATFSDKDTRLAHFDPRFQQLIFTWVSSLHYDLIVARISQKPDHVKQFVAISVNKVTCMYVILKLFQSDCFPFLNIFGRIETFLVLHVITSLSRNCRNFTFCNFTDKKVTDKPK